ncbi:MAG: D-alanyl-D-alanine carboxypeptidase family protein [Candidatus Moraniibacteriota bacterium]
MLFITAYLIGILLLPIKENIKNISNHGLLAWPGSVVGTFFEEETPIQREENAEAIPVNPEELAPLPPVPRLKEGKKKGNDLVVWAKKAILFDADSGKILYQDKILENHQIASITKVMTALVLMDKVKDWDEKVEISSYAASAGGATVHFLYGEKFFAKDLFKAMLMNSDNTAARALAEHFGGTEDEFVGLMNEKVQALGLKNTKFADTAGLDDDNSHSCAYDVALMAKEVLNYPMILETMQTPSHIQITSCDEFQNTHQVGNTDELLGKYSGILGAKTGFTYSAGYCLMMMREITGKGKVIGVLLDAGELGRWTEMQKMIDWAFDRYKWSIFP